MWQRTFDYSNNCTVLGYLVQHVFFWKLSGCMVWIDCKVCTCIYDWKETKTGTLWKVQLTPAPHTQILQFYCSAFTTKGNAQKITWQTVKQGGNTKKNWFIIFLFPAHNVFCLTHFVAARALSTWQVKSFGVRQSKILNQGALPLKSLKGLTKLTKGMVMMSLLLNHWVSTLWSTSWQIKSSGIRQGK